MSFKRLSIYCLPHFPYDWDGDAPKDNDLPIELGSNLSIENVSDVFSSDLQLGRSLSAERVDSIMQTKVGLVHRYTSTSRLSVGVEDDNSWKALYMGVLLLRLIKPMREVEFALQVAEQVGGKFEELSCNYQYEPFEVVEVQKLNELKYVDIEQFRQLYSVLTTAMNSESWKFRLAAQFYELGHTERCHWKSRYFLWMAGLDALVATDKRGHKEQKVVKARLMDILGLDFPMYSDEEFPVYLPHSKPDLTLSSVLDDLFALRNDVIHGHRVETTVYSQITRHSFGNEVTHAEQLMENASRILRSCLITVLRGPLEAYSSQAESENYWRQKGLVYGKLPGDPHPRSIIESTS